jgi:hypothetical protein
MVDLQVLYRQIADGVASLAGRRGLDAACRMNGFW